MDIKIGGSNLPLTITRLEGFQAPSLEVLSSPYAILDGAFYQGNYVLSRKLRITGILDGDNASEIITSRDNLWEMLTIGEEFTLEYEGSANPSTYVEIDAIYDSGLEDPSSHSDAEVSFSLVCPYPYFRSKTISSVSLQPNQTLTLSYDNAIRREDGVWCNSPLGANPNVIFNSRGNGNYFQVTDNYLYFTAQYRCGHNVTTRYGLNISAFNALQSEQHCYIVCDDDTVYSFGKNAASTGVNIIRWDGTTWTEQFSVISDAALPFRCPVSTPFGLYVALNSSTYVPKIYHSKDGISWNEVFSSTGVILDIQYYQSLILVSGSIPGGAGLYDPITFSLIKQLPLGNIDCAVAYAGVLYFGYLASLYSWQGGEAKILSQPSSDGGPEYFNSVFILTVFNGDLIIVDSTSYAPITGNFCIKTSNNFYPFRIFAPSNYRADIVSTRNFVDLNDIDSISQLPSSQNITYNGTNEVSPKFSFSGSGYIYSVEVFNYNNNIYPRVLFKDGYNISAGEIVTIDCKSGEITSSTAGSILSECIPNSSHATMVLRPGDNIVGVFAEDTVTGSISWEEEWISGDIQ